MTHCNEEDIYLYDELDATARQAVDSHLSTCAACSERFANVMAGQRAIHLAAADRPQPANASALTSSIMATVAQQAAPRTNGGWLNHLVVRWAMVAASVALAIGFVYEQQTAAALQGHRLATTGAVTLKTKTWRQWQERRQRQQTYSLYACAQSLYCDNTLINTYKSKKETW